MPWSEAGSQQGRCTDLGDVYVALLNQVRVPDDGFWGFRIAE